MVDKKKKKKKDFMKCTSKDGEHNFSFTGKDGRKYCVGCGQPKGYKEDYTFDKKFGEYMAPIAEEGRIRKRLNEL